MKKPCSVNVPIAVIFIFMMLLSTNEVGIKVAEGKLCHYRSQRWTGPCVLGHDCHKSCLGQGFAGGECHGLRHLCYCYKNC
ncbi:hypothetical protein DM860_017877 [Cuscuta australis]|uniref:Knottins-like domain-containing protein n=1 Tax=Cuscuta australis TaxID=267555 RepID=A0A328DRQ4_9ASTE|nr:hypothetical protein DM860_017877 [Cuscuta australis]